MLGEQVRQEQSEHGALKTAEKERKRVSERERERAHEAGRAGSAKAE